MVLILCSSQKDIYFGKIRDLHDFGDYGNPRPTRFCRLRKIVFKKESQALVNEEVGKISDQISSVTLTQAIGYTNPSYRLHQPKRA